MNHDPSIYLEKIQYLISEGLTHGTEKRKVRYRWHPWYDQPVLIKELWSLRQLNSCRHLLFRQFYQELYAELW